MMCFSPEDPFKYSHCPSHPTGLPGPGLPVLQPASRMVQNHLLRPASASGGGAGQNRGPPGKETDLVASRNLRLTFGTYESSNLSTLNKDLQPPRASTVHLARLLYPLNPCHGKSLGAGENHGELGAFFYSTTDHHCQIPHQEAGLTLIKYSHHTTNPPPIEAALFKRLYKVPIPPPPPPPNLTFS